MKKQALFLLFTILSLNCFSQITFEKGYYIDETNQRLNCLIRNVDWRNNPNKFEYKLSEEAEIKTASLNSVKEFAIKGVSKYVRSEVEIDRSSKNINKLSTEKNPVFQKETLFLKVLVEGRSTLYEYVENNLKRYFYKKENSNIEQLIYKKYKTSSAKIGENNRFRQQLWLDLKCADFNSNKLEALDYEKNELVNFFIDYNRCHNQEFANYSKKPKKDFFNLTIRPRLNNSSLQIQNSKSEARSVNFENKFGPGIGVEAEFILPFNKNKWAIILEPTYRAFKAERVKPVNNLTGGELVANVDYSSIELPIGLRYYLFLNNHSKFFVDATYVIDFDSNSFIEYTRNDGSMVKTFDINSGSNLAFGLGYKLNNKYSVEARYQTTRQLLGNYFLNWSAEFNTSISIILGYSLF